MITFCGIPIQECKRWVGLKIASPMLELTSSKCLVAPIQVYAVISEFFHGVAVLQAREWHQRRFVGKSDS